MQRYFSKIKENDYFKLDNEDIYHIKKVMRMKDNDLIEIVYNGDLYICRVDLNKEIFYINEKFNGINNNKEVTLIVPLLKEQKMDLILQKSTELGADFIIPIITERSVVKLDKEKFEKKKERWQKICKEASEQSKRYNIPIVKDLMTIDTLDTLEGVKLVCSTAEKQQNVKFFLQTNHNCAKIVLAIGPEGGFTNLEEDTFEKCGFSKISLGNRIMRVETVPMFLLSVINYENME